LRIAVKGQASSGAMPRNLSKTLRNAQVAALLVAHEQPSITEAAMADGSNSKSKRGFGSMSAEKQREIASKGGKSVPSDKRSFFQNRDLAAEAGP
jgi:general stress protein YciG